MFSPACEHCHSNQLALDRSESPPEPFCVVCGWRPAPLVPLPFIRDRPGQGGIEQPRPQKLKPLTRTG